MTSIVDQYRSAFADHEALAKRARVVLPDGVTSDSRRLDPFPLYIEAARGARKWDAKGREFIDLWGGHGSLLFGHAAPEMIEATSAQLQKGTHFGACHISAATWAERIVEAIPSAACVRFTASGTEAVLLALRLARAFTGRPKVLRFIGHYHGWNSGNGQDQNEQCVVTCSHDLDEVTATLDADPSIGVVILEPTGPCSGILPLEPEFVRALRWRTQEYGVLLVFDEIVTGFRLSESGAQGLLGVEPDLTTLAKITCGGMPGGAVAGCPEILGLLANDTTAENRARMPSRPSLPHLGTFSGNPVSAAAGVATLTRIADTPPYAALAHTGQALRDALNRVFDLNDLDWVSYGEGSCVKLLVGHGQTSIRAQGCDLRKLGATTLLGRGRAETWSLLRLALLLNGVDMSLSSFVSTAHDTREVDEIALAFERSIAALGREGALH